MPFRSLLRLAAPPAPPRAASALFVGRDGGGRQEAVAAWATQAIAAGSGLILLDAGRGAGISGRMLQAARALDRGDDVLLVAMGGGPSPHRFTPIGRRGAPEDTLAAVRAAIECMAADDTDGRVSALASVAVRSLHEQIRLGCLDHGIGSLRSASSLRRLCDVLSSRNRPDRAVRHAIRGYLSLLPEHVTEHGPGEALLTWHRAVEMRLCQAYALMEEAFGPDDARASADLGEVLCNQRILLLRLDPLLMRPAALALAARVAARQIGLAIAETVAGGWPAMALAIDGLEGEGSAAALSALAADNGLEVAQGACSLGRTAPDAEAVLVGGGLGGEPGLSRRASALARTMRAGDMLCLPPARLRLHRGAFEPLRTVPATTGPDALMMMPAPSARKAEAASWWTLGDWEDGDAALAGQECAVPARPPTPRPSVPAADPCEDGDRGVSAAESCRRGRAKSGKPPTDGESVAGIAAESLQALDSSLDAMFGGGKARPASGAGVGHGQNGSRQPAIAGFREQAARDVPSMVVIGEIGDPDTHEGRDIMLSLAHLAGTALPLPPVPDLVSVRRLLCAEFPHAEQAVGTILDGLCGQPHVRMRPTVLVGEPGCGKTTFAPRLFDLLGVRSQIFPCGGIADNGIGGCARKWSTCAPSLPVSLVRLFRTAAPGIVLDEIHRVGTGSPNGNALDVLLGMLEPESARRWLDPYVAAPVDISSVLWIGTANSLSGLPKEIRDRCRVIPFPEPKSAHIEPLANAIIRRLTLDRGLDERWVERLTGNELDALVGHWQGGSIRKLARLAEGVLRAREQPGMAN